MEEKDIVIKTSYLGKKIDMTYKQLEQFIKDAIKDIIIHPNWNSCNCYSICNHISNTICWNELFGVGLMGDYCIMYRRAEFTAIGREPEAILRHA